MLLLALAMFCSYIFMDILSPIKDYMMSTRGWDSTAFGTMQGAETFLNVFVFFLIFAGIILDKMGVRFTAVLSGVVMLIGALIQYYAVTEVFNDSSLKVWLDNHLNYIPGFDEIGVAPFYKGMPASAKLAAIGFMIFGCGTEMGGITVSRGIVKWFKGRETALAMGSEMALARLGVATCMTFSPFFCKLGDSLNPDVSRSVAFGVIMLCIALMMFIIYFFMDKKLDAQTGEAEEKDDPFKISDIGKIFSSLGFWLVALLCVLYYSAIFPFQKYAVDMMKCNLALEPGTGFYASEALTFIQYGLILVFSACAFASNFMKSMFKKISFMVVAVIAIVAYCWLTYKHGTEEGVVAVFPLLAVAITPILGKMVDNKGKAATMLMLGSLLLIVCHLTFAFVLPMFKGNAVGGILVAYATILVLGASFSLVPAALWPSVPKLVDEKIIGSAYALIFWIQNIGLWLFPILIGKVLDATNTELVAKVAEATNNNDTATIEVLAKQFDYTWPLIIFACLGVASFIIGIILKGVDKKKHLGLEEPTAK